MVEIGEISAHLAVVAVGRTNGRQILVVVFVVEVPLRCGLLALVVVCFEICDADVDSKLGWLGSYKLASGGIPAANPEYYAPSPPLLNLLLFFCFY